MCITLDRGIILIKSYMHRCVTLSKPQKLSKFVLITKTNKQFYFPLFYQLLHPNSIASSFVCINYIFKKLMNFISILRNSLMRKDCPTVCISITPFSIAFKLLPYPLDPPKIMTYSSIIIFTHMCVPPYICVWMHLHACVFVFIAYSLFNTAPMNVSV